MFDISHVHGTWKGFDWNLMWETDVRPAILYAPTLGIALKVTPRVRQYISDHGTLPSIIDERLSRCDDKSHFPIIDRPKIFHLAIGLTHNCTLFCDYCHAEADKDVRIDRAYIDAAIEHAFKMGGETPKRRLSVSFAVGGEPTMNWPEFTYAVDKIRNLEKINYYGVERVYLSMTTNCYYGKDRREYVAEKFDKLTLSLDGDADVQNKHRPTRSGKDSYPIISKTVKFYIDSKDVDAAIRGTVSEYSVKKLKLIINHYHSEFGSGYTVALEPLIVIGRAVGGFFGAPSNQEFAMSFWKAKQYGAEKGIRVITSAANIDRLVGRYCGAMSIPSFTVCTNGALTACHRDQEASDYGYGFIDKDTGKINIDNDKILKNMEN